MPALGGTLCPEPRGLISSSAQRQPSSCLAEDLRLSDHDGTLRYIVLRKVSET